MEAGGTGTGSAVDDQHEDQDQSRGGRIREERIELDGVTTRYLTAGDGPPVVLLHALGESSFDWRPVMPRLATTCTVFALDLPGLGPPDEKADYSGKGLAAVVRAFLDSQGIDRFALVGNSLGGLVAIRVALANPERVTRLMLVNSAGLGEEVSSALLLTGLPMLGELTVAWGSTPIGGVHQAWTRANLLFADVRNVPEAWLEEQKRLAATPGFNRATLQALRADLEGNRQRDIVLHELPKLSMPTLVVWGMQDKVFPPSHGRAAVDKLQKGSLELIENCGHLPQVEKPEEFARLLEDFLGLEYQPA